MHIPADIAVAADPAKDVELLRAAARLSVDLNLPFLEKPTKPPHEMLLVVTPERLEIRVIKGPADLKGGKPVYADLTTIDTKSAAGKSLSQPILKAVGLKKRPTPENPGPTVIDATAGWGEDSWLLAALGCRVLAVERNKIIFTMLRDAVLRAGSADPTMLQRLTPVRTDARHMLRRLARMDGDAGDAGDDLPSSMQEFLTPDVVLLDPMFPEGRKTAERKPMKVLRRLVGNDLDAGESLFMARRVARKRVVVKRPMKADPLGGEKPDTTFKGKSLRYDVYLTKGE